MAPDRIQGRRVLTAAPPLRRKLMTALIIYTGVIFIVWFSYHFITYDAIKRTAEESAVFTTDVIARQVSAGFEEMATVSLLAAGSDYLKDFLMERDVSAYYEKAGIVSEIIHRTASPVSSIDNIVTFTERGEYYRFIGGVSNGACEELYYAFHEEGLVFTIIELDGVLFFCHNAPVYDSSGLGPIKVGSIVILTGLDKTRRVLGDGGGQGDLVAAIVFENEVLLSNDPSLEGGGISELPSKYHVASTLDIEGTPLSVLIAIPEGALFAESRLFFLYALIVIILLLLVILLLYHYLSSYMIRPMASIITHVREIGGGEKKRLPDTGRKDFDALISDINDMLARTEAYNTALIVERQRLFDAEISGQKMRMGLLASQMDAHFVVNTLANIKTLSDRAENERAAKMAEGLALILKHQHKGDELINIFIDLEVIESYISIMNTRFGEKFIFEFDIEDVLSDCIMPGFVLQPLVENALVHGLKNKEGEARLFIKGALREDMVCFEISDNGAGIPPAKLEEIQNGLAAPEPGDFPEPGLHGVALLNIQRRISLRFGEGYGISVASTLGKGTTVTVRLPALYDSH